jgi:hypothetical protein
MGGYLVGNAGSSSMCLLVSWRLVLAREKCYYVSSAGMGRLRVRNDTKEKSTWQSKEERFWNV